ncbi:MAG: helix-turn-helix domain-containing protein [Candidatus Obscuribacterales bacterium]|nr:helix-turn-helix domain-containing protein [Candidatus Obscuribacterales bacterium]
MGPVHPAQVQAQEEAQGQAHVSITEAARMLGIDRRYALRLAHKGKLSGHQDEKSQWFISIESIKNRMGQAQGHSQAKRGQAQGHSPVKMGQAQEEAQVHDAVNLQLDEDVRQSEAMPPPNIDLAKALVEISHKLEHATYRNGWLEAKLEEVQKERDQAIKLLTDSQHKPSWWAKFSSWFFKGQ